MQELKNEDYDSSPLYVVMLVVGAIVMIYFALLLTAHVPITNIPYIGNPYAAIFESYFDDTFVEKEMAKVVALMANVYIYWCLLVCAFFLLTDVFFRCLIGAEMGVFQSISHTFKVICKYVGLSALFISAVIIAKPLADMCLTYLDTDTSILFVVIFHFVMVGTLFNIIKWCMQLLVKVVKYNMQKFYFAKF